MAQKRMFTMKIVDSDAFLEMPLSTQCLYFHLNMRADDDGFVGNPRKILRMIGASEDDLKILIAKKFLLWFDTGIVVIKHWWMHNTLAKDRYTETSYIEEKSELNIKENKSYTLSEEGNQLVLKKCNDNKMLTNCYQNDNTDLDKISIDKISKDNINTQNPDKKTTNTTKKKNPKAELFDRVDSFTQNQELRDILKKYLKFKLTSSKINLEQWDIQLNNLAKFANGDILKAINQVTISYANSYQALVYCNNSSPKKGGAYDIAANHIQSDYDYSNDGGKIEKDGNIGF